MFSSNWFRTMNFGRSNNKVNTHLNCSILAVAFNGTTRLSDKTTNVYDDLQMLYNSKNHSYDEYGIISYIDDISANPYRLTISESDTYALESKDNYHSIKNRLASFQDFKQDEILNGKVILACTKRTASLSPYTFTDPLRNVTYTMVTDGEVEKNNLLLRLSGFVEWLDNNSPETLSSNTQDDIEYLFLWLVKSILQCNGDVLTGLHKGLSMLSKNNIGGHYNILFSDGNGVFAFSNNIKNSNVGNKLTYKISRNVHNIYCYVVKNCKETPELGWTDLKEHNLYYFPTHGAMQVYANIDTNQYSDTKFKAGVNWVCLSLLSC